jgi:hypothetical protein
LRISEQRLVYFLIFSLLIITPAVYSPTAVAADSTCVNPPTSRGAGANSGYSGQIFGAQARIEFNNPDLCGSDTTGAGVSTIWAMVSSLSAANPYNPDANGWAQSGYGQFGQDNPIGAPAGIDVFAQYTYKCKLYLSCTGATVKTVYDTSNPTDPEYYDAFRSGTTGFLTMRAAGTVLLQSQYDPFGDWHDGWDVEFYGETKHAQDDLPGTAADHTNSDQLAYLGSDSAFHYYTGTLTTNVNSGTRYHASQYTPSSGTKGIQVWTDPLS